VKAGAQPVGAAAVELLRIASGIPRYGQDIRERDLPQETEQLRALNFTKGCYIGQEIVERIRARGRCIANLPDSWWMAFCLRQKQRFERMAKTLAKLPASLPCRRLAARNSWRLAISGGKPRNLASFWRLAAPKLA